MTDRNSTRAGLTRRSVLKTLTVAIGAAAALPCASAGAAEALRLDVKDAAAMALGYVENVAQVDLKKYPDYRQGSNCENCLQLQGAAGNNYRPCSLFPGKLVSVSGWCKAWTPEM